MTAERIPWKMHALLKKQLYLLSAGMLLAAPVCMGGDPRPNIVFIHLDDMDFDEIGCFGCAGVARIPNLQKKLNRIGRTGYRHHVSMTFGLVGEAVREAFSTYLGYTPTDME